MSRGAPRKRSATPCRWVRAISGCSCIALGHGFGRSWKGTWMVHSPLHISCQEVVELVSDYVEQALPADEATVFEQHLNFCDGCIRYVDQVRKTINVVGELRAEDVPDDTKEQLLTAFRDRRRG